MTCKECNAPTTVTPEEAEVCTNCGLLQEDFFPIISMEVERYVTARAEYYSTDNCFSNLESLGGTSIAAYSSPNENNAICSTLLNQRNQQNFSKLNRILRLSESLKAICYKHFNDGISHEAIKILKQKENQWRNNNKYQVFGACIYLACMQLSRPLSFADIALAINNSVNGQITSFNEIGKLVKKITSLESSNPAQSKSNSPSISSSFTKENTMKKKENLPIPSIPEHKSLNNNEAVGNSLPIANKTRAIVEGIMNKHYILLKLEYSTLQRAIALVPKYLDELEGRKPATIAAACFLKVSDKLTLQSVGKVLGVSRPTLTSALKLCK
jgi:transcription initiation factor TFIIIB Brf1 subunit/transcription initiation factor TFIIB